MNKVKNIILWIITGLFVILAFAGGISTIFFLSAAVFSAPIPKLKDLKKEKLKIGTGISALVCVIAFVAGAAFMPKTETESNKDKKTDSSTTTTVVTTTEPAITTVITTETPSETESTTTTVVTTAPSLTTTTITTSTTSKEEIPEESSFSIRFIDVGQADAALIECDGHYMLIDGGNVGDSNVMYSVLKNEKVDKLDIIVGTHAHEDHIGGLPGALNYATAELILSPVLEYDSDAFNDFKKYAEQKGNGLTVPKVGNTYKLGNAEIEILGVNEDSEVNDTSIVLMIEYGDTSFLFTGDAERETEQAILNRGKDLSATLLKVGHHGSETSTSYVWLNAIMPEYAIISVGEGNSYNHPTDAVLSRLRDADVKTYRTDLNGDILVVSDGKTLDISTDKSATDEEIFTPGKIVIEPETNPPTEKPTEPSDDNNTSYTTTYILNTNTKKFHYPDCSSVSNMKESNKSEYTGTREEILDMGYSSCGRCHP